MAGTLWGKEKRADSAGGDAERRWGGRGGLRFATGRRRAARLIPARGLSVRRRGKGLCGPGDVLPADAPQFVKDYYGYYKTKRGYHKRSLNSNGGWNKTSALSFINMPILSYSGEIRNAVLMIHGEKAHSCYFSKDAFKKLKGDNKQLLIIPGANHVDLYDPPAIPFDKIENFFKENLK